MRSSFSSVVALVILGLSLVGCAGAPPPSATAPRHIVLVSQPAGERLATTYWRNGDYDDNALHSIALLFRDRRSEEVSPIDPGLIDLLHDLRAQLGLPSEAPIHVLSGFRSRESNAALRKSSRNVAENSYHIRAKAVDIRIPGVPPPSVAEAARILHRGGYAYYPSTGHTHVDTGPVRTWKPR